MRRGTHSPGILSDCWTTTKEPFREKTGTASLLTCPVGGKVLPAPPGGVERERANHEPGRRRDWWKTHIRVETILFCRHGAFRLAVRSDR